jgi:hypothetical protein
MAGQELSKIRPDLRISVQNYKQYLNSTDAELKQQAKWIDTMVRNGLLDQRGRTTTKYDTTQREVERLRTQSAEQAGATGPKSRARTAPPEVLRAFEEAQAALAGVTEQRERENAEAVRENRPLPHPQLEKAKQDAAAKAKPSIQSQYGDLNKARAAERAALPPKPKPKGDDKPVGQDPPVTLPPPGDRKGTGKTGSTGLSDAEKAQRTQWVSYLSTAFKTLDPKYKKDIDSLFAQARRENWTEATFLEAIKGTKWWQTEWPTTKDFFLFQNDPRNKATFAEKLSDTAKTVTQRLEALGLRVNTVDKATGKVLTQGQLDKIVQGIALDVMKQGLDDKALDAYLSKNGSILFTGGGSLGLAADRVRARADMYGVDIDAKTRAEMDTSLLDPEDGRDESWWMKEMERRATEDYAPFADGFAVGRNLWDMTRSYRNQMAELLEVDAQSISWKDLMARAVGRDDKGNSYKRSMAEFRQALKQDPEWQFTKNAREEYTKVGDDLLKMFGVTG